MPTDELKERIEEGDRVRLLADIYDYGDEGHHPPGYLARKGETLIVRKLDPGHGYTVCISHEQVTDNSFRVAEGEVERLGPTR